MTGMGTRRQATLSLPRGRQRRGQTRQEEEKGDREQEGREGHQQGLLLTLTTCRPGGQLG